MFQSVTAEPHIYMTNHNYVQCIMSITLHYSCQLFPQCLIHIGIFNTVIAFDLQLFGVCTHIHLNSNMRYCVTHYQVVTFLIHACTVKAKKESYDEVQYNADQEAAILVIVADLVSLI